ncbi:MAG: hypothetical protein JXR95_08430 [Deltaproteobacteria bacterium]|nr:hypothetical protein [Deltaproteobacteria bacterium]
MMMQERRNIIRRYITGGLAIGAVSGLFISIPDSLLALYNGDKGYGISIIFAFHLFTGICWGGISGFLAGFIKFAVEKVGVDNKEKDNYYRWIWTILVAFTVQYPIAVSKMPLIYKIIFGIGLTLSAYTAGNYLVKNVRRIFSGYTTLIKMSLILIVFMLLSMVFASSLAGYRLIKSTIFWEILSVSCSMISIWLFVLIKSRINRKRSFRKRQGSFIYLAKPAGAVFLLVGALGGITWVSWNIKKHSDIALKYCERCNFIMKNSESSAMDVSVESRRIVGKRPHLRIRRNQSFLVITDVTGTLSAADVPHWSFSDVLLVSEDTTLNLASIFSGNHYGLRSIIAPWIGINSENIPMKLTSSHGYNSYFFTDSPFQVSDYIRQMPYLGFRRPVISKYLMDIFSVEDLMKPPFISWVHITKKLTDNLNDLVKYMMKKDVAVITVSWHEKVEHSSRVRIYLPSEKTAGVMNTRLSIATLIAGLTGGRFSRKSDLNAAYFPSGKKEAVFADFIEIKKNKSLNNSSRKLVRKINGILKASKLNVRNISPYKEKQKQFLALERLICRGYITQKDVKFISEYSRFPSTDPDVFKRLELLELRLGRKEYPLWFTTVILDFFRGRISDIYLASWVLHITGISKNNSVLRNSCPGIIFQ